MLKIGLIGSKYLIDKHAELIKGCNDFQLVGTIDSHLLSQTTALEKSLYELEELLEQTHLVYLFGLPEEWRMHLITKVIKSSNHVLIDKSNITNTAEAKQLLELSEEAGVISQVCNLLTHSPLFIAAQSHITCPTWIESVTNINYKNKSAHLLEDFLYDELSMVVHTVNANLRKVNTSVVDVFNATPEIVHLLLEFDNGCNASITVNSVADDDKKVISFYSNNKTISIDFLENTVKVLHGKAKEVQEEFILPDVGSQAEVELRSLAQSVLAQKSTPTDFHTMSKIHDILQKVTEKLKINFSLMQE